MSKIKKIKIKQEDGTFSAPVDLGANAVNVDLANGKNVEENFLGYNKVYNSKIDMAADAKNIIKGMKVRTLGYYEINDGGGAEYYITDIKSETEYQEDLGNRLYATLILNDKINVLKFGCKNDGVFDCFPILEKIKIMYKSLFFPRGIYFISNSINIESTNIELIYGEGSRLSEIKCPKGFIELAKTEYFYIHDLTLNGVDRTSIGIKGAIAFSKIENLILRGFEICINTLYGTWINEYTNIFFKYSNNGYIHTGDACNNVVFKNCQYQHISNICNDTAGYQINFTGCDIESSHICFNRCGRAFQIDNCYIEGNEIIINLPGAYFQNNMTIAKSWLMPNNTPSNGWLVMAGTVQNVDTTTANLIIKDCMINNQVPDSVKPFSFIKGDGNKSYLGVSLFTNSYYKIKTNKPYNIFYDDLFDKTNCKYFGTCSNPTTFSTDLPLYEYKGIRWYKNDDGNIQGYGNTQRKIKMIGHYPVVKKGLVQFEVDKNYGGMYPQVNNIIVNVLYEDGTIQPAKMSVDTWNYYIYCDSSKNTKEIIFNCEYFQI